MTERTLVLIKPDAVRRGLVGEVLGRFERKGLAVVALDLRTLDGETADQHYAEHVEQRLLPAAARFITSGPLVAMVLEGDQAIAVVRGAQRGHRRPGGRRRHDPRRPVAVQPGEPGARLGLGGVGGPRDRDLLPRIFDRRRPRAVANRDAPRAVTMTVVASRSTRPVRRGRPAPLDPPLKLLGKASPLMGNNMSFIGRDMAVDLGTANTLVYVRGKGIVLNEPSVVAINTNTGGILAVGAEAKKMIGRTPGNIVAIRPLKDGVIADFDTTERMLRYFIQKVHKRRHLGQAAHRRLRARAASPGSSSARSRTPATQAGARKVYIIEEPMAAAIGAGLPVHEPTGNMVVDIGGGTTEVAVISLGGIVTSQSIRIGGDELDQAIIQLRQEGVLADARRAHRRGDQDGDRVGVPDARRAARRDPRPRPGLRPAEDDRRVSAEEIRKAIEEPVNAIVDAVKTTLDKCPPELSGDIMDRGIVLTGGGALLKGLDERLRHETGMPIHIADDPLDSVALGLRQVRRGVRGAPAGADLRAAALTRRVRRRSAAPRARSNRDTRRTRVLLALLLVTSFSLITIDYRGGDARRWTASARPRRRSSARSSGWPRPSPSPVSDAVDGVGDLGDGSDRGRPAGRGRTRSCAAGCAPARWTAAGPQELDDLLQLAGAGRYRIVPAQVIAIGAAQTLLLDRHARRRQPGRHPAGHDGPQRRRPGRPGQDGRAVDRDRAARRRPGVLGRRPARGHRWRSASPPARASATRRPGPPAARRPVHA